MISKSCFRILGNAFDYAHLLKIITFKWDWKLSRSKPIDKSKLTWFAKYLQLTLLCLYEIFLIFRSIQWYFQHGFDAKIVIIQLFYVNFHLSSCIFQTVMVLRQQEIMSFTNQFIQYFVYFQGNYFYA